MEKIIVEQMLKYLLTNNLISKQQHGFLSRRSTATNLIESLNDWTVKMENRQGQSVAYIDFAKAFDSVSHPKLLTKLGAYGIGGVLLNWISDFFNWSFSCDKGRALFIAYCIYYQWSYSRQLFRTSVIFAVY
jgi:hypothetical protein